MGRSTTCADDSLDADVSSCADDSLDADVSSCADDSLDAGIASLRSAERGVVERTDDDAVREVEHVERRSLLAGAGSTACTTLIQNTTPKSVTMAAYATASPSVAARVT